MAQLAVVLLALFAQMERTYAIERAAHARAVVTAKGRRTGRPISVDADKLAWAAHLCDSGAARSATPAAPEPRGARCRNPATARRLRPLSA
jgi:hypothetical protein